MSVTAVSALTNVAQYAAGVALTFHAFLPPIISALCGASFGWYRALPPAERDKTARRLSCVAHHTLTAAAAAWCLFGASAGDGAGSGRALFHTYVLHAEAGFDVADTIATHFGLGLVNGGPKWTLYAHHTVALLLEGIYMFGPGQAAVMAGVGGAAADADALIPWRLCAAFVLVLLGSGALDIVGLMVLPLTSAYRTSRLVFPLSVVQLLLWAVFRIGFFLYGCSATLMAAYRAGSVPVLAAVLLSVILMTLYHLLLGMGLIAAVKNGGRLPPRPLRPDAAAVAAAGASGANGATAGSASPEKAKTKAQS